MLDAEPAPIMVPAYPGTPAPCLAAWSCRPVDPWEKIRDGVIPDPRGQPLRDTLAEQRANLDRIVAWTSAGVRPEFPTLVDRDFVDDAPVLLALRGLGRCRDGGPGGVDDLVAAFRLARAAGRPAPRTPALFPALHGVRAESSVLQVIACAAREGRLAGNGAARLAAEIAAAGTLTYGQAVRMEVAWTRHVLAAWGATGRWTYAAGTGHYAVLSHWLPRGETARAEAARRVGERLAAAKERELIEVAAGRDPMAGRARPPAELLGYEVPAGVGAWEFARGCAGGAYGEELALAQLVEATVPCARHSDAEFRARDALAARVVAALAVTPGRR